VRVVIDTNVLVSGLIKQGTPPAEVVADVLAGELVPLYDQRTIDEYREVLSRPRLKIPTEKADALLELIIADGLEVHDARFAGQLPDPDDQPFADVAFTGKADLLITGNTKDFRLLSRICGWPSPADRGVFRGRDRGPLRWRERSETRRPA
jgi:putative PIN family toxin of toxin-antitoxin system